MIEAIILGVPFVAALVYLVIELFDLHIWWNKRKLPPDRPPGIGDTWPEDRRAESEERWRRMFNDD